MDGLFLLSILALSVLSVGLTWAVCRLWKWKFSIWHFLVSALLPQALVGAAFLYLIFVVVGSNQMRFEKFQKEIKQATTPEQIQQWALSEIAKHRGENYISSDEVPSYLNEATKFRVEMLNFSEDQVWIVWGGGFGHWGLVVGDKNLKLFPKDFPNLLLSPWTEGVYFFIETE